MIVNPLVSFLLGGALLVGGAELLVRGASRLAVAVGISPLVIGLTVVAVGTSAPELAVTVGAALGGEGDVALGNVVGSNIFNVLFILGASALIAPLVVARRLVRLDVPLMIALSVATLLLALDGRIGRIDGALLVMSAVTYTVFIIRASRRETAEVQREYGAAFGGPTRTSPARNVASIALGLILLVFGSRWLVAAAVATAEAWGVSELVIGLTIVAAGTSLPEVATSVMATIRGERDIAVGNVIGSNIFNLLVVLGLGGLVAADGLPVPESALTFDLPIMIAVAIACAPILLTGYRIARWEAVVFLGYYAAYTAYLIARAADHGPAGDLLTAIVWFAAPLTILILTISVVRHRRTTPSQA